MNHKVLAGALVLVHPKLENDRLNKQGRVGILLYASSDKENFVKFPGGSQSVYPASGLLLLKDKKQIVDEVMNRASEMTTPEFKAMYKIMLLQDRGNSSDLLNALEIARDNPSIWEKSLQAFGRSEKIELDKAYAR